jgi:hypothetical protein
MNNSDKLNIVDMEDLAVNVNAESFYKFNWRMYADDAFRLDFYENPTKTLDESGFKSLGLDPAAVTAKEISPLTMEECRTIEYVNSPEFYTSPVQPDDWWYTAAYVAVDIVLAGIIALVAYVIGAPTAKADQVPQTLKKVS